MKSGVRDEDKELTSIVEVLEDLNKNGMQESVRKRFIDFWSSY